MLKTTMGLFVLFHLISLPGFSQCPASSQPSACTGTEPLVVDGETLGSGTTKWYYGGAVTMSSLTLDGGTLIVCGNLTVDKLYMNTGKVFIRQGARFVIGSGIGSGLQFKGDCAIYNYGTCEIQRNLSLENNASALFPNVIVNALSTSVFLMSNQYFVINNANSWFVNNGRAEFWGIITDALASPASVCLGNASISKMAILINKVANSYIVSTGNACVQVLQFSEFYGKLTSSPTLFACLGSAHTSSTSCIPFGCQPNNWGAAQVATNCAGCAAIMTALPTDFLSFSAMSGEYGTNQLQWTMDHGTREGNFEVLRSTDGIHYVTLDRVNTDSSGVAVYNLIDKHPFQGNNYYMIRYTDINTGKTLSSRVAKVITKIKAGWNIYPVPFTDKFTIKYEQGTYPQKISMTDADGRNINIRQIIRRETRSVEVFVTNKLQPGLYIIYLKTDKNIVVKPVLKN